MPALQARATRLGFLHHFSWSKLNKVRTAFRRRTIHRRASVSNTITSWPAPFALRRQTGARRTDAACSRCRRRIRWQRGRTARPSLTVPNDGKPSMTPPERRGADVEEAMQWLDRVKGLKRVDEDAMVRDDGKGQSAKLYELNAMSCDCRYHLVVHSCLYTALERSSPAARRYVLLVEQSNSVTSSIPRSHVSCRLASWRVAAIP